MYNNTVTVFNRLNDTWYATVLYDVNVNMDKGAIVKVYGSTSQDNIIVNVHCNRNGDTVYIGDNEWLSPKEWQTNPTSGITFQEEGDAFLYVGEWDGATVIDDDDYGDMSFQDYMLSNYDFIFTVTSVGYYSVIPHFEIAGK